MHSLAVVQEIERLLRETQLSRRQVAQRLGISRGSVNSIAKGERGVWGKPCSKEDSEDLPLPARCPKCGYYVLLPCNICIARVAYKKRQALAQFVDGKAVTNELKLNPHTHDLPRVA